MQQVVGVFTLPGAEADTDTCTETNNNGFNDNLQNFIMHQD